VKFLLVGTAYPHRGGIAHYIALLARTLEQRGHDVQVLSFSRQYPSFLFPGKSQDEEGPPAIPVRAHPLIDTIDPLSWWRAARWAESQKPDLTVFKYWMPFFAPAYNSIVRHLHRKKVGRTCFLLDNVIPHERRPGDLFLTRMVLAKVDTFVAQSEVVRNDLLKFRPDAEYRNVPHPVYSIFPAGEGRDTARRKLGATTSRVMLFFGFIRGYKGLLNLIKALARIDPSLDVGLLVAGEFYEDDAPYKDEVRRLGLENRVFWHDHYIANEDVGDFFSAADMVVLPYESATQSGIVQIAMNYGTPIVTTNVGGLPEVVKDGVMGYVVPPGDPKALAGAVTRFYRENREAEFRAGVERERARYSWDPLALALEEFARAGRAAVKGSASR
jgi:glycosyltransferase involved in cell wall biosynthesis